MLNTPGVLLADVTNEKEHILLFLLQIKRILSVLVRLLILTEIQSLSL
jgi:hypothetical protein